MCKPNSLMGSRPYYHHTQVSDLAAEIDMGFDEKFDVAFHSPSCGLTAKVDKYGRIVILSAEGDKIGKGDEICAINGVSVTQLKIHSITDLALFLRTHPTRPLTMTFKRAGSSPNKHVQAPAEDKPAVAKTTVVRVCVRVRARARARMCVGVCVCVCVCVCMFARVKRTLLSPCSCFSRSRAVYTQEEIAIGTDDVSSGSAVRMGLGGGVRVVKNQTRNKRKPKSLPSPAIYCSSEHTAPFSCGPSANSTQTRTIPQMILTLRGNQTGAAKSGTPLSNSDPIDEDLSGLVQRKFRLF